MGKRGRPRKDHGTTFDDRGVWHFGLSIDKPDGSKEWAFESSGIRVGTTEAERKAGYHKAELIRRQAQNALNSARDLGAGSPEIPLAQFVSLYAGERKRLGVKSWKKEQQPLSHYVLPELGHMKVVDIRPRHLIEAYAHITSKTYEMGKLLSQKSIDHAHRTLRQVFEFAAVRDLIPGNENPCDAVGPRYRRSKAPRQHQQRTSRSYTLEEVALLTSHPDVPLFWRCVFGVEALAMTRVSETARLRFDAWNQALKPLGELYVDGQKTDCPRWVPVHPHLAGLLAEWKLSGYAQAFGRHPTGEDIMFPYVGRRWSKKAHGSELTARVTWGELQRTLARLGLLKDGQPRPQHGLRRAGSAAMADAGVSPHDRECITHKPDLSNMQERYDAPSWGRLCRAVSAIALPPLPGPPKVLELPVAVGGESIQGPTEERSEFLSNSSRSDSNSPETPEKVSGGGRNRIGFSQPSREEANGSRGHGTVVRPRAWGGAQEKSAEPSGLGGGPGPRRNQEIQEAVAKAADLLENRRGLPVSAVRPQALELIRRTANRAEGRLAYALEVAAEVLARAEGRAISETIAAKTIIAYALRELGGAR